MTNAAAALKSVIARVEKACLTAGRDPQSVQLVAVSKTFDAPDILPVLEAGQRVFGENRVQEAKSKWPDLRQKFPGIELHLIGPLQSNKAAEAVALFDVFQTVDRPKIAEALKKEMQRQQRDLRFFIQVNTGDESQKAGVALHEADAFIETCRKSLGLKIQGLMCIPPVDQDPSPHFQMLKQMAARHGLKSVSMGMSGDFEQAVAAGGTHVRIGSAIFGSRPSNVEING